MGRLKKTFLFFSLLLILPLPGCYTVLKHPATTSITDPPTPRNRCIDCHHGGVPGYRDPFFYGYYRFGWWSYYGRPWWYDYNYYPYPQRLWSSEPVPREKGKRHLWKDDASSQKKSAEKAKASEESPKDKEGKKESSKEKKEEKKRHLWKDK